MSFLVEFTTTMLAFTAQKVKVCEAERRSSRILAERGAYLAMERVEIRGLIKHHLIYLQPGAKGAMLPLAIITEAFATLWSR